MIVGIYLYLWLIETIVHVPKINKKTLVLSVNFRVHAEEKNIMFSNITVAKSLSNCLRHETQMPEQGSFIGLHSYKSLGGVLQMITL